MNQDLLIKKIAMSFAYTTGLEFEDLFQEACLGYLEALKTYNPSKSKITTYVWYCVSNRLKNYIKKQEKFNLVFDSKINKENETCQTPFWENLSNEAQEIAKIVISSPKTFLKLSKTQSPKVLKQILLRKGWDKRKINYSLFELKLKFSN